MAENLPDIEAPPISDHFVFVLNGTRFQIPFIPLIALRTMKSSVDQNLLFTYSTQDFDNIHFDGIPGVNYVINTSFYCNMFDIKINISVEVFNRFYTEAVADKNSC
jgi:hypothetical protein